jgi:hypothetical protein
MLGSVISNVFCPTGRFESVTTSQTRMALGQCARFKVSYEGDGVTAQKCKKSAWLLA